METVPPDGPHVDFVKKPFNMNDPYGEMQKALDTLRGVVDAKPFITQLAEDTAKDGLRDARLALLTFEQFIERVRALVQEAKAIANEKYGMGGDFVHPYLRACITPVEEMLPDFFERYETSLEEAAANRAYDKGS